MTLGLSFLKGKLRALDRSSNSQMMFQGDPELSGDTSGVGGYVEGETKSWMEGHLMNAKPASRLMQKTFLAFGQECSSDELDLVYFSLNLASAREGGVVIIKALGKLRGWSMIQEARYWEVVKVGLRPGLEDAMEQVGEPGGERQDIQGLTIQRVEKIETCPT